jgi:hypothetical protein
MPYSICEVDANRCAESLPEPGEVKSPERVARILHTVNAPSGVPDETTFPIDDLALRRPDAVDHSCGASGGASVQRICATTIENLLQQSRDMAASKPSRKAIGIAVAVVSELRKITVDQLPGQVVFLLADGSKEDPGHSVIRFHPNLTGGLQKKVRKAIIDEFRKHIVRA